MTVVFDLCRNMKNTVLEVTVQARVKDTMLCLLIVSTVVGSDGSCLISGGA